MKNIKLLLAAFLFVGSLAANSQGRLDRPEKPRPHPPTNPTGPDTGGDPMPLPPFPGPDIPGGGDFPN